MRGPEPPRRDRATYPVSVPGSYGRPAAATAVASLQRLVGNQAVVRLLSGDSRPQRSGALVQRRNGFRPPPRRPPQPRARGRHGQRPGQRRPSSSTRRDRDRRERRRRKQQARIRRAREAFEREIAETQKRVERWGRGEGEPRSRILKALLKFWELVDQVGTEWYETHEYFDQLVTRRNNLDQRGKLTPRQKQHLAQREYACRYVLKKLDAALDTALTRTRRTLRRLRSSIRLWPPGRAIASAVRIVMVVPELDRHFAHYRRVHRVAQRVLAQFDLALGITQPVRVERGPRVGRVDE